MVNNYIDILSTITGNIPDIFEWPYDIFTMCELAEKLHVEPGVVSWQQVQAGKISFSGLLSKGKPPGIRDECIVFEMNSFTPAYIELVPGLDPYYKCINIRGIGYMTLEEVDCAFGKIDITICDTMPAICKYKDVT